MTLSYGFNRLDKVRPYNSLASPKSFWVARGFLYQSDVIISVAFESSSKVILLITNHPGSLTRTEFAQL